MAKEQVTISIRAYAAKLQIDDKSVRKAISDGKIKKGVVYVPKVVKGKLLQVPQIVEAIANKEYGNAKKVIKPQAGVSKSKVVEKLAKKNDEKPKKVDEKKIASPQALVDSPEVPAEEIINDRSYAELIKMIKIDETLSYGEATRRNEILEAAFKKIKLEQLQNILVEKALVDKALFDAGNRLKTNLQNIPSRVISLIRSAPNEIDANNILLMEINQVLEELSDIKTVADD